MLHADEADATLNTDVTEAMDPNNIIALMENTLGSTATDSAARLLYTLL